MFSKYFFLTLLCIVWGHGAHLAWQADLYAQSGFLSAPTGNQSLVAKNAPFFPKGQRNQPLKLALGGYCPVTLRDHQQWLVGLQGFQAIRDDRVYFFASARARDIFVAAPELYLPVLDGDCPVTFADSGTRETRKLQWGLLYQGRLYFFASQAKLLTFEANPAAYVNADLMEGGFCVVSKIEEHRLVEGLPATVAIAAGMRYYFASAFHRKLFVLNPQRYGLNATASLNGFTRIEIPQLADTVSIRALKSNMPTAPRNRSTPGSTKNNQDTSKIQAKGSETDDMPEELVNRAMSGYCPVTITKGGLWLRGKPMFKSLYDDKMYLMVGSEELVAFQENPRKYVPVLSGDSVVTYASDYKRTPGSIFHAAQYNSRLYLFANAEEKIAFGKQPSLYENVDLAYRGNCAVSQFLDKQEALGSPEFVTFFHGKRYHFVSRKYLDLFLADPRAFSED